MRAKKALGQNFLKAQSIIKKMVSAGEISSKDTVLEIGPGKGALTAELLQTGAKVVAIEKDSELIPILTEKFQTYINSGHLILTEGDALDLNTQKILGTEYKVVANIPYYITGALIRFFLESEDQPTSIVFLMQKEVAQRICAKDGKSSILSLSVQAFSDPKYIMKVAPRAFSPAPKIDSAIVQFTNINKSRLKNTTSEAFFGVIKQAFSQKRKTLVNNLKEEFSKESILEWLKTHNLPEAIRPEKLDLQKFLSLSAHLRS